MLATPAASSSSISLTLDELRWLEASAIIELTPSSSSASLTHSVVYDHPHPSHAHINNSNSPYGKPQPHLHSVQSLTSPSRGLKHPLSLQPTPPATPPRRSSPPTGPLPPTPGSAEWIYRRPKSPVHTRARSATVHSPYRPRARPQTGYHSHKPSSPPHTPNLSGARIRGLPSQPSPEAPFWTGILRPRSRSERSMPALKTIPSQSQIALTEPPSPQSECATTMSMPARPQVTTTHRPPSITSSISSTSSVTSHSSSRLETPLTPSPSSSPHNYRRPSRTHQRRSTHPGHFDPRLPPPASKSILTRTSSISTKGSASVSNKSVKFAEMPTVHYANKGQWELARIECREDDSMGMDLSDMDFGMEIDVDSVDSRDMDTHPGGELHHPHLHHNQRSHHTALRELQCSTPTPEKERAKAKSRGLWRLIDLATSRAPDAPSSTTPARPSISSPFALGTLPPPPPSHSTTSLRRGNISGTTPLRSAPSLESFRSARSVGGRSIKSVGSVKSTASTRGFRTWLGGLWRDA